MSTHDVRQVIIVSQQAKMPKGKTAAQVAHASLGALLAASDRREDCVQIPMEEGGDIERWMTGSQTKVTVKCDDPEEMKMIYLKAKEQGVPCSLIIDEGRTHFEGVPTLTTVGLGPASAEALKELTGHLKLL